ncbi:hypothetical protein ACWDR0_27695 [Streptomyces sp. NPDC003691]
MPEDAGDGPSGEQGRRTPGGPDDARKNRREGRQGDGSSGGQGSGAPGEAGREPGPGASGGRPGQGLPGGPESGLELLLEAELRALGRAIRVPEVDGETMAERVVANLLAGGVPAPSPAPAPPGRAERVRHRLRRHRRALALTLSGVLVALALTPPVRASVVEWADRFDFGGIDVRYDPEGRSPDPGQPGRSPAVPGCGEPLARAEAEARAGFGALVPKSLGAPDAYSVTVGAESRRVLTLCWSGKAGRVTRLDQFPARLDPGFIKTSAEQPEWVRVGSAGTGTGTGTGDGGTGLWFARPHLLRFVLLDRESTRWEERRRTAGPTLLWMSPDGRTTLRLEGVDALGRALAVAESVPARRP